MKSESRYGQNNKLLLRTSQSMVFHIGVLPMTSRAVALAHTLVVALALSTPLSAQGQGPVARWNFDEGQGSVLHDQSGSNNHGRIHGAAWMPSGKGGALRFDGVDDYVDCGTGGSLDITGPITLQAWVKPTAANRGEPGIAGKFFESYALTYYGNAYFYISSGGNNVSGPTLLGQWRHIAGVFDGTTMRCFVNGIQVAERRSRHGAVKHGGRFTIGCIFGDTASEDPNLQKTAFFPGLVDDVRLHDRALSAAEIALCYNEEAAQKGCEPFDPATVGHLLLEPFFYPEAKRAVLSVNFRWVLPLPTDVRPLAELARVGSLQPVQTHVLNSNSARGEDEVAFSLEGLPPGQYELRARLREPDLVIQAEELSRNSKQVTAYHDGWQKDTINLYGGWAEYEFDRPPGDYEVTIRAARIHDAAGVRCTIDGSPVGEIHLAGQRSGGPKAWAEARWERMGNSTLTARGHHTLRLEVIPAAVPGKPTPNATHVYLDAIALSSLAADTDGADTVEKVTFDYPFPQPPSLPSPDKTAVPPLPEPIVPPTYDLRVTPKGIMIVSLQGETFRVESRYSCPNCGSHGLEGADSPRSNTCGWQVEVHPPTGGTQRLTATGRLYGIERTMIGQRSRILVRDTIRNTSGDLLGVIVSNRVNLEDTPNAAVTQMANPTIFAAQNNGGLGLIALSDLYQLRHTTAHSDGIAQIRDEHVGLAPGATYILEWAAYPTATVDYYDFINQVREDEKLNGHVEGALAFVERRDPPSSEFVARRNLAYSSIGCLGKPLDNPATPLEGFEFVEYPKECAALADTFARTKNQFPEMKVMFHVAHSLYICNNPRERFPDSLAIDQNGRQLHYGPNSFDYYGRFIPRSMFDDNWRWWLFYPTPTNSFGQAMIAAVNTMVEDVGATGMWADGYISGYVRDGFSYDGWDGHSVTIDPESGRVTGRKICVPYVALPVLKQCARIISDAGGVLVSNGHPGPRSYWRENTITSCETGGGDARPVGALHLGRTVTPLGNPRAIQNERDYYRDMLTKLDFGALFFWYGGPGKLTRRTLTEHMYPITFESIHAGTVRGKERIVTKRSGVYGWPGERREGKRAGRELHAVYLYDARGTLTPHAFVTAVDGESVRTGVNLTRDQAVAIVKIPVTLESTAPVNVRVTEYSRDQIRITLNGRGEIHLTVQNGGYVIGDGEQHTVTLKQTAATVTSREGRLGGPHTLNGSTELTICRRLP